ncbi:HNH endonuclease [Xanthomonas nasturtii]|uniref:HNH endonuclease n=1 Tax=Xanthomonas nasturtii TaxID=1843581 RepID=A0ABT0LWG5_9XANT|nr:HNH endonuclease [Xanthomonas nasturtii]MCL1553685.1 HNH endonuclease [Xanthomonas nasturtii]MCL1557779.1 HNH endonuclease [Xanthomonas nasturtii]MCL1561714.1 HNH endonuclease [Xanthomonas nasturtii]
MAGFGILNANQLLSLICDSIYTAGWSFFVSDADKPFGLVLKRPGREGSSLRIFIWNCTHGGGAARAADEFRIQFTGSVPAYRFGETVLLLGWYAPFGVFAAWDIERHQGQDSGSPSAQIREEILRGAYNNGFAVGERANGEIVAAFRPELLAEYAMNSNAIHNGQIQELNALNDFRHVDVQENAEPAGRERVTSTIVRAYREADFSRRVLAAYSSRCVMCGVQLKLIEAAHIVPVAAPFSTDFTSNGIALCALHHKAYDSNLVSVAEDYSIEISKSRVYELQGVNLGGGIEVFVKGLNRYINLPADRRDYPSVENISKSRQIRGWR